MIRALLVLLLTILSQANAWEFSRSIFTGKTALLELRVPGDSALVVDSIVDASDEYSISTAAIAHFVPNPGRHDSIGYQRWSIPSPGIVIGICFGNEGQDGCILPIAIKDRIYSGGFADCPMIFTNTLVVSGDWPLASALRSFRSTMDSMSNWQLYRYAPPFDTAIQPASDPLPMVDDWFRSSPWNQRDSAFVTAQWLMPDSSVAGHFGTKPSIQIDSDPFTWKSATPGQTDSLRTDGAVFEFQRRSGACDYGSPWSSGTKLLTNRGGYTVLADTLIIDTSLSYKMVTSGMSVGYQRSVLRARIALKDLDSLLRNPPAVGVSTTPHRPSPLHISGTRATLEAGASFGRMELVDASGQILSKVTGTGRLTLSTCGHGLRWVRWTRGAEQGAQAVVF